MSEYPYYHLNYLEKEMNKFINTYTKKAYFSKEFNYIFDKQDGQTIMWGETYQDDPEVSPFNVIVDFEITENVVVSEITGRVNSVIRVTLLIVGTSRLWKRQKRLLINFLENVLKSLSELMPSWKLIPTGITFSNMLEKTALFLM